jgi:hypothetical protein
MQRARARDARGNVLPLPSPRSPHAYPTRQHSPPLHSDTYHRSLVFNSPFLYIPCLQEAHYLLTRQSAAEYMLAHSEDFGPFLPSFEGEDGTGPGDSGVIGPQEYARYCATIRDTSVWGGEPEILALSRAYAIPIHVVQGGQPPVVVHDPNGAPTTGNLKEQRAVWISYHRRMYGLGEVRTIIHSPTSGSSLCSNAPHPALQLAQTKDGPPEDHEPAQTSLSTNIKFCCKIVDMHT